MVSINYSGQQGIIKNSEMDRYTIKSNFDQKISEIFKAGINTTISRINNSNVQLGDGSFENSGIIAYAISYNPSVAPYDEPIRSILTTPSTLTHILASLTRTKDALTGSWATCFLKRPRLTDFLSD